MQQVLLIRKFFFKRMTTLVALLSTGKGSWASVSAIMKSADWDQIILFCPSFAADKFNHEKKFEKIIFNPDDNVFSLRDYFKKELDNFKLGTEVALNLSSGNGKEHMALMSALLRSGVGIRFVVPTNNGFEEV